MLSGNFAPQFPIELIEKDFSTQIELQVSSFSLEKCESNGDFILKLAEQAQTSAIAA